MAASSQKKAQATVYRANFVVYKAEHVERTFVVASTSASRDGSDAPDLPDEFQKGDALDRLATEITAASAAAPGQAVPVILRVHGYNTRRWDFENDVLADADPMRRYQGKAPPAGFDPKAETFRPDGAFLVGFRWPSEGLFSKGSLRDTFVALWTSPVIGSCLVALPFLALLSTDRVQEALRGCVPWLAWITGWLVPAREGAAGWLGHSWPSFFEFLQILLAPYREMAVAAGLLGAGLLFLALRLSTYSRDRYRALHYGVPDLGEFMRALEERFDPKARIRIKLHVVGHSMGSLVLINAFRVMSDYFHGPDGPEPEASALGRNGTFQLGTMILCAADIPAIMATPDHNNYFLSALRRFEAMHVLSSDRDIILKWLSLLVNWMSEPRYDMAGRKLGNVVLVRSARARTSGGEAWTFTPMTRAVVRNFHVYEKDPLPDPQRARPLHFYDCTMDRSLAGSGAYLLGAVPVVLFVLWWLTTWGCDSVTGWLLAVLGFFFGLGLICHFLWPTLRDRTGVGSVCGMFADWTAVLIFLPLWFGWNPHGGYFMFCRPPRQTISALLRLGNAEHAFGTTIRYQMIRVSV